MSARGGGSEMVKVSQQETSRKSEFLDLKV